MRRLVIAFLLLSGCNALVGIEPLRDYRSDGGAARSDGVSAAKSDAGDAHDAHDGGVARPDTTSKAGAGGQLAEKAGTGGGGAAQEPPKQAEPTSPGSQAEPKTTIRGKVIDARGRARAGAAVNVAKQSTTTMADGSFELHDVAVPYDLGIIVNSLAMTGLPARSVWLFRGLTRIDPVLEVYPTPYAHFARIGVHAEGPSSPLPSDQRVFAAFGGADLNASDVATDVMFGLSGQWSGSESTQGTLHALLARIDEAGGFPVEMLGYAARPAVFSVTPTSDAGNEYALDVSMTPQSGIVSGRVVSRGGWRENWAVLRWTDGSALRLPSDGGGETFSLTVPSVTGATVAAVALEGSTGRPPYAVAFSDVAIGGSVDLTVPTWPMLVAPGDTATIAADTKFEWTAADGKVFVMRVVEYEGSDELYVVTSETSTTLPTTEEVPFEFPHNQRLLWTVEMHGTNYANVDEATGENGFLSPFWESELHVKQGSAGVYANAERRDLMSAP